MRRTAAGILILMLLMLGGCVRMEIPVRKEEAKEYLERKYRESFTLYSSMSISIDQPYGEMVFFSESHPEAAVHLYDDEKTMRDNYFGILARKPMQEMIDTAVKDAGMNGKAFFVFRSRFFPDSYTDTARLPELLAEEGNSMKTDIDVFTDAESPVTEADFDRLCGILKERNIYGTVMWYRVSAEELKGLNQENYDEYLASDYEISPVCTAYLEREGE